jgi:quercetin dioxygenase-like cupin family protein
MQDIQLLPAARSEKLAFDWGELTWFASGPLGNSADLTVGRCVLKPGCSNPRHYHPNCSEILVVIKGRILHTIAGGGTAEMREGDTVNIPANIRHCAKNICDTEAVLFIAFSSAHRETIGE